MREGVSPSVHDINKKAGKLGGMLEEYVRNVGAQC